MYTVHPVIAYAKTILNNVEKTTGKSLKQWSALLKESGCTTVAEQRAWLKNTYGVGGTTAQLLADYVSNGGVETDEGAYLKDAEIYVAQMYDGAKQHLRPVHDALINLALSLAPGMKISPCKTIVPLYRNHVIAQIKPAARTRIDFGLALKKATEALPARLISTGGAQTNDRITHRFEIQSLVDIDEEVAYWLKRAYELDV